MTSSGSGLVLSSYGTALVILGLGALAFLVLIQPALLLWLYHRAVKQGPDSKKPSFFEVPFITWFLVHYGIAALAVLAIVALGVDNVIDKGTVSALLGSLFGYVLGSSAKSSPPPKLSATTSKGDTDEVGDEAT